MLNQPVPKVTDKDVERIALRDYGSDCFAKVMSIIHEYGKQEWNHPGSPRVLLAILKLANGDIRKLTELTQAAIDDYRNVLSMAEYPRYTEEIVFKEREPKVEQKIITEDWNQYQEWLERK
jgi:hypothetical protein